MQIQIISKTLIAATTFLLWLTAFTSQSYTTTYISLALSIALFISTQRNTLVRLIGSFFLIYLGIGLLNISDYRGTISITTINIYFLCVIAFLLPVLILVNPRKEIARYKYIYRKTPLLDATTTGHLLIVYAATLYIYATKGIIILNQDRRFGIPTALGYTIRSCLFIPIIYMCLHDWRPSGRFYLLCFAAILPSFLIGSRSTGLVSIFSMIIFYFVAHHKPNATIPLSKKIKIGALAAITTYLMIGVGFYVRRIFSPDLMTGQELIREFFNDNQSFYIYLLLPFHQGFNETTALTSRIIDEGISNVFSGTILFLADFDNLLGRSNIAAAQYFGDEIGRVGDGGLTPGMIGGLYMDIQEQVITIFFIFGLFYAFLVKAATRNQLALCITAIFATQFMHLFHRGFVKPEYITVFLITFFYFLLLRKSKA